MNRPQPHSWPGDPEPDFDDDLEEEDQGLDDLPGVEPANPGSKKKQRGTKNQCNRLRKNVE